MPEFFFAKGSSCDLLARVANRGETHRSSSAPPPWRIEPVRSLDTTVGILDDGGPFVDGRFPPHPKPSKTIVIVSYYMVRYGNDSLPHSSKFQGTCGDSSGVAR